MWFIITVEVMLLHSGAKTGAEFSLLIYNFLGLNERSSLLKKSLG